MESTVIIPEIETEATKAGIAPDGIVALQTAFAPHFQAFAALAIEAKDVQQDEPKKARSLRLKIRAVRIASDDTHKEMKADSLRRGRAIDGIKNILLHSLVPVEEGLEKIEKAEELRAAAKREALKQTRTAEVQPFSDPTFYDLAGMPDAQYSELLAGLKAAHAAKIAAAEAAEIARQEAARAAEAERMRIVQENARLQKLAEEEREAREKAERVAAEERAEAERKASAERAEAMAREKAIRDEAEKKAAAERAEAARLAKIEADKRDAAERARREKERKDRAEAEAKAAAAIAKERAERERIQAEVAAREKAEAERIAMEQAAAKRAAAAPDREKILALASAVGRIEIPELNDDNAANKIREQFAAMSRWLVTYSTKIGE